MKRYRAALFAVVAAILVIPLMAAPAFAQAPTANDDLNQTLIEDGSHTINPLTNDVDNGGGIDPTSVFLTDDVTNGATSVDPVTGEITYLPVGDFYGLDTCSYTVDDGAGNPSNVAIVEWNVTSAPDPPVAVDDAGVVDEDASVVIDVAFNDSDVDGDLDVTTVNVITGPSNGTTVVNPGNGEVTYSPDSDYNGSDQFEYEIFDLTAMGDTATVLLTVNPMPDPPVAVPDTVSVNENGALWIDVLANDTDLEDDIDTSTVTVVLAASHGTVFVDTLTSWVLYTPDADFNGLDSFTYIVDDATALTSNEALVYINIISDGILVIDNVSMSWENICGNTCDVGNEALSHGDSLVICVYVAPHDVDEMMTGWPKVYLPVLGGDAAGDSLIPVDADTTRWCFVDAADSSWYDIPDTIPAPFGSEWDAGFYYIITEVEGPSGITRDSILVNYPIDTKKPVTAGRPVAFEMTDDVNGDGVISDGDKLRFFIDLTNEDFNEICQVTGLLEGFYGAPVAITLTDPSFTRFYEAEHTVSNGILDTTAGEMVFWFHVVDNGCNEDSISATLASPVDNEPPDLSGWAVDFVEVADLDSNGCLGLGDSVRIRISGAETVPDLQSIYVDLLNAGLGGPDDSTHEQVALVDSGGGVWLLDWELQVNPQSAAIDAPANTVTIDYVATDDANNSVNGVTPAITWPVDTEVPDPILFGVCGGSLVAGEWVIALAWSGAAVDADWLYLYWDNGTGTIDYNAPIAVLPAGVNSWSSGGTFQLSACTDYLFDIWTIDDCGNWELEHPEPAMCERQAVNPVADLDAESIDGGHIVLTWGAQSSNAGSFDVYYGMGEDAGVIDYTTSVATLTDTSLHTWSTEGTLTLVEHGVYWFDVWTTDTCGNVEDSHPVAVPAMSDLAPAEVCVFQPEPGGTYTSGFSVYACPKTAADHDVISVTAWGRLDGDTVWTNLGSAAESNDEICFEIALNGPALDGMVGADAVETIELAIGTVDQAGKVLDADAAYLVCDPVFTFDWSTSILTALIDDIDGDVAVYQMYCDFQGWEVSGATNSVTTSISGGTAPYRVYALLGGEVVHDASGVTGPTETFNLDVTNAEPGGWALQIWWTDAVGHTTAVNGNLCVPDTEAPCITIIDPVDGKYIRRAMGPDDNVEISVWADLLGNCVDPAGVLKVDLQWSSAGCAGPWNRIGIDDTSPYSFKWYNMEDLAGLAQGATIYLQATVWDEQENSATSACVQVYLDTDTPPLEISSPDVVDCGGVLKVNGTFEVQAKLLAPYVDDIDYIDLYSKRSSDADVPGNWSTAGVSMIAEPTNETLWRWNVNTAGWAEPADYDFRLIATTSSGLVSYDMNGDEDFDAGTFSVANPDAATWYVDNTDPNIAIADARTTIDGNSVTISNVGCELADPVGHIWTQYGETVEVDAAVIPLADEADIANVVWELVDAAGDVCDCPEGGTAYYLGEATVAPYTITFNPADYVDATDGAWQGVLRVTATDCLGQTDVDCVEFIVLDIEPTEAIITDPMDGETVSGNVTLEAAALNAETIVSVEYRYRTPGGGWTVVGSSTAGGTWPVDWHTMGLADGPYELAAFATDQGGSVQTTVYFITVHVSNAAPTVYILSPAADAWVGACAAFPVTAVARSAADNSITVVYFDYKAVTASGWIPVGSDDMTLDSTYVVNWNVSLLSDGWYHLRARVELAGGQMVASAPVMVRVDATDPDADIMSVDGDETPTDTEIEAGTAVEIIVDAWDVVGDDTPAGLSEVMIWVEHDSEVIYSETFAAAGNRYTTTWPTAGLELGSYYVYAEVVDAACNDYTTPSVRVYLVDEILPVAWIAGFGEASDPCPTCASHRIYAMTCDEDYVDAVIFEMEQDGEWVTIGVGYDDEYDLWSTDWRPCDFEGDYRLRAVAYSNGNADVAAQPILTATFAAGGCGVTPTDPSLATVGFIDKTRWGDLGLVDVTTGAPDALHTMLAVYAEAGTDYLGYEIVELRVNVGDDTHLQGNFDNGDIESGGVGTFWAAYNVEGVTYLALANLTVWRVDPDLGFPGCAADASIGAEVCIEPGFTSGVTGAFMMPAYEPTLGPGQTGLQVWGYADGMVTAIRLTDGEYAINSGKYAKIKISYMATAPDPSQLEIAYWSGSAWVMDSEAGGIFIGTAAGFDGTAHTVEFFANDLHGMYAVVSSAPVTIVHDGIEPWCMDLYTDHCPTVYTAISSNADENSIVVMVDGYTIHSSNGTTDGFSVEWDDVSGLLETEFCYDEDYDGYAKVIPLGNGSHTITVEAANDQGAVTSVSTPFLVDVTAPEISWPHDYVDRNPVFEITITDAESGVDWDHIQADVYDYDLSQGTVIPSDKLVYEEHASGFSRSGNTVTFSMTSHLANYRRLLVVLWDGRDGGRSLQYYDDDEYNQSYNQNYVYSNHHGVHDCAGNSATPVMRMFTVRGGGDGTAEEAFNEPNPFDPWAGELTNIHLNADGGSVSVKIYDLAGVKVITLADNLAVSSTDAELQWDGHDAEGDNVAQGVYLCHISGRNNGTSFSRVLKIAVVKRD